MNNVMTLWQTRKQEYWSTAVKYLRLIGNSGFLFAIYILFLFGSYYYGRFLEWLPENFPAVLFFTLVFAWMTARGRVRTFVKQADLVFLLPMEERMKPYFRSSLRYSWLMETGWITLLFLVLAPLYSDRIGQAAGPLLLVLLLLSLLKGWNLAASFEEQRIGDETTFRMHKWLRFFVNTGILFLLFSGLLLGAAISALGAVCIYYLYFKKINGTLQWQRLIEIENDTVRLFYRIANNFTDVPHLKESIRERKWLSFIYRFVSYSRRNVYKYLFARAFLRSGDYFGVYMRLTFLGVIFILAVDLSWGRWLMGALFSYMTVLQMETLRYHFRTSQMPELYPLPEKTEEKGLIYWLKILGIVQIAIFTFASGNVLDGITVLAASAAVYVYVIYYRIPKRNSSG